MNSLPSKYSSTDLIGRQVPKLTNAEVSDEISHDEEKIVIAEYLERANTFNFEGHYEYALMSL